MTDTDYLNRAIKLAKLGEGYVKTNPLVGAVLVYNNRIIGEGYHKLFGGNHAEIEALNSVKSVDKTLISKSTFYITLEPCSHHGKTPPCAQRIIDEGISKVVVGCIDPNPEVAGRGIAMMKNAGIDVQLMPDSSPYQELISAFNIQMKHQRPNILLKWAQSADNYIGKAHHQVAISSTHTKHYVHAIRSKVDAILVGKNTIRVDNPSLDNRLMPGASPTKIVFDQNYMNTAGLNIYQSKGEIWGISDPQKEVFGHYDHLIEIDKLDYSLGSWHSILNQLYKNQIGTLLIEGGAKVHQFFLDNNLWDEMIIIKAPIKLGSGIKAPVYKGYFSEKFIINQDEIYIISK